MTCHDDVRYVNKLHAAAAWCKHATLHIQPCRCVFNNKILWHNKTLLLITVHVRPQSTDDFSATKSDEVGGQKPIHYLQSNTSHSKPVNAYRGQRKSTHDKPINSIIIFILYSVIYYNIKEGFMPWISISCDRPNGTKCFVTNLIVQK